MYTLTYTSINHNNQNVLLSYVFIDFFFRKIPHECGSHVTLSLTLSLNFDDPIYYVSSNHMQNFINIDQRKL